MTSAVVFGGYGTFGSQVARELSALGVSATVAGRNLRRAEAFAQQLGPTHRGTRADVTDAADCQRALAGHAVAVNCAGPFSTLGSVLLEACLDAGCHYVDIADAPAHCARVRALDGRFRERGRAAVYGSSALPALSQALATLARADLPGRPERARLTLFIGNDNPKGEAAVRSAVSGLGRPIRAPQGTLRGFRDREVVALPPPFGARAVYNFDSPDYDLAADRLGVRSVVVKVGFELRWVTLGFAALAALGPLWGDVTARLFVRLARLAPRTGCSGGVLQAELFAQDSVRRVALAAEREGQRMAALPAALAAHALLDGRRQSGALTADELLGAVTLVAEVTARGFRLVRGSA